MACDRCGGKPDADVTRFVGYQSDEEILGYVLCPQCSYGLNTLVGAYVANRDPSVPR
jgi:hypothetical protein